MTELRFDGRSVIVTGAGRGMGRCHVLLLASRGARVVVADFGGDTKAGGSSGTPAHEVVAEIKADGVKPWPATRRSPTRTARRGSWTPPSTLSAASTSS